MTIWSASIHLPNSQWTLTPLRRFKATIGDREVITEVKRKAEAQAEFDAAVRQGHTAVQLQQGKGSQLYKVDIGNLVSMEECVIEFCYVRILNSVAGSVEFEHSATWVPPYQRGSTHPHPHPTPLPHPHPHPHANGDSPALTAQDPLVQNDASILPSSEGNPTFSLAPVTYKLSYQIKVRSSRGFTSIECPTASTPIKIIEEGDLRVVNLDEAVSDPSKDFTLLIEVPPLAGGDGASQGNLLVQECMRNGKKKLVALATFLPPTPPSSAAAPTQHTEIVFIIDGSGSMGGSPIAQALEASLYFVKDLPVNANISLNVAVFGSSYSLMWPQSKAYNELSQKAAVEWIQDNVHANYGGTEVLSVLQAVYSQPIGPDATRQIIFLTDGGVDGGEESRIFDLIEGKGDMASKTSIFSLGIGHGVHRGLVEGVAKRSGGVAQFVVDGEPLAKKIGMLKKCALAAGSNGCYSNPKLLSRSALIRSAPNVLPPRLFPGQPFSVLAEIIKSDPTASLDLSFDLRAGKITSACPAQSLALDKAVHLPDGDALSVLHAMACIGSLLNGSSELHLSPDGTPLPSQPQRHDVEDAVVLLAISEGLVTPHTSAVGVLLQKDPLDPSKVQKVEVPLQVPAGRNLWKQGASNDQLQAPWLCRGAPPMAMACAAPQMQKNIKMPRMMMKKCAPPAPAPGQMRSLAACAPTSYAAQDDDDADLMKGNVGGGGEDECESLEVDALVVKKETKGLGSAFGGIFGSIASAFGSGGGVSAPGACAPPPGACTPPVPPPFPYVPTAPSYSPTSPASNGDGSAPGASAAYVPTSPSHMPTSASSFMAAEESVMKESAPVAAPILTALPPSQVLSMLNLKRTINGSIPQEPSVMEALAGEGWKSSGSNLTLSEYARVKLMDAIPPSLAASEQGDEVWATVLSLAWLKKHAASDKAVWAGLEAKAVAWLGTVWKGAGGNGSVGASILSAMKLL